MEGKENMASGVRVIGAEAPSNYQVALRPNAPAQRTVLPSAMTPMSSGVIRVIEKKKRGRPRKYGPDGPVAGVMSLGSSSSTYSSGKQGKGGPSSLETRHSQKMEIKSKGGAQYDGSHFTPHVITVNAGEDVTAKIISFCQQGPRAICILSANGTVSNATLSHYDPSGGTSTYEGRFEIVNLCGCFAPTDGEGTKYRAGGLSIVLSSPSGQVVGGCVAGLLMAAAPVQIIVGSFLPDHRPNKLKSHAAPPSAMPPLALPPADNGKGKSTPAPSMQTTTPSPFGKDSWPSAHVAQHSRNPTDISISLPRGS